MDTNTDIPQPCYWYTRGYLPHYDDQLRTQFVTFRLADSLPKAVLDKFKAALDRNLLTEIEYHRRLDRFLDTGYGSNFLKDPKIADTVAENLYRFHDDKYRLLSWVIMPNHVHILIAQLNETPLAEIMHSM